jgi:hypothetical protein
MKKFWFRMNPSNGRIQGKPTNLISVGGNYVVRKKYRPEDTTRHIRNLRGKATKGGTIDIVQGKKNRDYVRFTADPITGSVARSELAPRKMSDFGQTLTVKMEFRVRAPKIDEITGYVLQFWQPVISPIAGVRVKDGRLEVVSRSRGTAASKPITKGWNELTVTIRPGRNGVLKVKGDLNGKVNGFINGGSQASSSTEDIFRPKFGWYGSLNQQVTVDYRQFEIYGS